MYLRADKRRGIVYAGPGLPTIRVRGAGCSDAQISVGGLSFPAPFPVSDYELDEFASAVFRTWMGIQQEDLYPVVRVRDLIELMAQVFRTAPLDLEGHDLLSLWRSGSWSDVQSVPLELWTTRIAVLVDPANTKIDQNSVSAVEGGVRLTSRSGFSFLAVKQDGEDLLVARTTKNVLADDRGPRLPDSESLRDWDFLLPRSDTGTFLLVDAEKKGIVREGFYGRRQVALLRLLCRAEEKFPIQAQVSYLPSLKAWTITRKER